EAHDGRSGGGEHHMGLDCRPVEARDRRPPSATVRAWQTGTVGPAHPIARRARRWVRQMGGTSLWAGSPQCACTDGFGHRTCVSPPLLAHFLKSPLITRRLHEVTDCLMMFPGRGS